MNFSFKCGYIMSVPVRITIAMDEDLAEIVNEMKENMKVSQSEEQRR